MRILLYLWASPGSLVGLALTPLALISGGQARVVDGVLEVHGGYLGSILKRGNPWIASISAITFGHVVLGQDQACLDRSRDHERVHVRQYERWGPLFIPAYLAASLVIRVRGGDPYRDNPFEVQAYREAP